jgi:hypothetical protein
VWVDRYSAAYSRIALLPMEVIELLRLDNLHIRHVLRRSGLKYLIAAKSVGTVKLGPQSQAGQKPSVLYPVRVTTPPRLCILGFQTCLEPSNTLFLVQTETAGGLRGPIPHPTLRSSIDSE